MIHRRGILAGGLSLGALSLAAPTFSRAAVSGEGAAIEAIVAGDAELRTIYEGGEWCEGPCWLPERRALVFSDVRNNRMMIVPESGEAEPFRDPSDNANGNILDAQGRLVTCQHRLRRVVREEANGELTVLADQFDGRRLNSPNDAVLAPDGAIWFTDPVFGIVQEDEGIPAEPEQSARRVYRIAPDGTVEARIDRIDQPNGIAFSPDGATLYVTETGKAIDPDGPSGIWAFAVGADASVDDGRLFAPISPGVPDGLAVDVDGHVFAACEDGIRIFDPAGRQIGLIATPDTSANVTFGGEDGRRLFITASGRVHSIDVKTTGLSFRA